MGNHVIISSDSKMAAHLQIDDYAYVGAKTGIIQFARIGKFAFIGGFNGVAKDILPIVLPMGPPQRFARQQNRFATKWLYR